MPGPRSTASILPSLDSVSRLQVTSDTSSDLLHKHLQQSLTVLFYPLTYFFSVCSGCP